MLTNERFCTVCGGKTHWSSFAHICDYLDLGKYGMICHVCLERATKVNELIEASKKMGVVQC